MKKKYCCELLQSRVELPRELGLNIRVIQVPKAMTENNKTLYRTFITPGYTLESRSIPIMPIAYCPFCGTNLLKLFSSEEYVNEQYEDLMQVWEND